MTSSLKKFLKSAAQFITTLLFYAAAYLMIEVLAACILQPATYEPFAFAACWAVGLAAIALVLPRLAGRIFFGVTYFFFLLWTLAQTGYCRLFNRMMWLTDIFYAGEGAGYLGDVLTAFPLIWWIGGILLLGLGVLLICKFPRKKRGFAVRLPYLAAGVLAFSFLLVVPELIFLRDLGVWGTRSEYAQSSSYRATYNTMYDARNVYNICGIYHLTSRDIWVHELYPMTPAYRAELRKQTHEINDYFAKRPETTENEYTGIFKGKNVVLVLMESMDDWMITPEDTPTLYKLMGEGIEFTNFYTPGYGTARTINSEFCINTGIYLPTTGDYVFDYVTNDFSQSIASQAVANGYTAEMFHYNDPSFYSRGVFEPAMGYNAYNCYADYETDKNKLYDDSLLFDIPELNDMFFREGQTFNTIITRSAHLSYVYNEVLSNYALKKYPAYRGKYGSQEEDCARVKAKLVDDMFSRLLQELESHGQLENTVIIGVTDHYTYGYKAMDELYALSGVDSDLLLEKTPCFVWSADGPDLTVDKTLNTSDFLPTMLNLLGYDSPYHYLGQDAFDSRYEGYVLFPNGSWICNGVACKVDASGNVQIIQNLQDREVTQQEIKEMATLSAEYIRISNLLLTSNYYQSVQ